MAIPSDELMATARELRSVLDTRLARRDRAGAVTTALDAVADERIGIADLYTLVLGPLLIETGTEWQRGAVKIWEEHYATATVRTIVESLYPAVAERAASTPQRGERVVLACPPGEQHDLGLRMLADRFALAGYDTFFLGADVPGTDLVDAVQTLDANMLVMSASTHVERALVRHAVQQVRELLPGVCLVIGGPAFVHDAEGYDDLLVGCGDLGLPGAEPPDPEA